MSAQLSRCVAVYSRHFVASRINAPFVVVAVVFTLDHIVTTETTMGWTKSLLYQRHTSSRDYDFGELPSSPEMTWRVRHKRDNGVITSLPAAAAAAAASAAATATRRRYRKTEVAISGV